MYVIITKFLCLILERNNKIWVKRTTPHAVKYNKKYAMNK